MLSGSTRLAVAWVGFPLKTLVDVSEQSRMAAEVMDFDCKMKNTGSTEFSEWGKLELRWNRSVGRTVEAGVRREVGEDVKVSKSKIKVQEDTFLSMHAAIFAGLTNPLVSTMTEEAKPDICVTKATNLVIMTLMIGRDISQECIFFVISIYLYL